MPPHKWYTNLQSLRLMPFGEEIETTVTFEASKPNRQSRWRLITDNGNLSSRYGTVRPELRQTGDVDESPYASGGRCFVNRTRVPDIGGDKYTVECRKKGGLFGLFGTTKTKEYQAWRRLWFNIYTTDAAQARVLDNVIRIVQQAFKEAFIDLKRVHTGALDFEHTFALVADNLADDTEVKFIKALHGGAWPALAKKPQHLLINFVKYAAKLDRTDLEPEVLKYTLFWDQQEINDETFFEEPEKSYLINQTLDKVMFRVSSPEGRCLSLLDNAMRGQVEGVNTFGDTIESFEVSMDGGSDYRDVTADVQGKAEYVNAVMFSVSLDGDLEYLQTHLKTGSLLCKFTVKVADITMAGQNSGNLVVIQTHEARGGDFVIESADKIAKTLIHEIGHALGLTPHWYEVGTDRHGEENDNYYTDYGGNGNHCKHHAKLNESRTEYIPDDTGERMCVMFHMILPGAGPEFCDNCMKGLRLARLKAGQLRTGQMWEAFTS